MKQERCADCIGGYACEALNGACTRDVLRAAGIKYSMTSSPDDPHVVVRRADVERLVRERDEARASDSSARDALDARRLAAGRETPFVGVSDEDVRRGLEATGYSESTAAHLVRESCDEALGMRLALEDFASRALPRRLPHNSKET